MATGSPKLSPSSMALGSATSSPRTVTVAPSGAFTESTKGAASSSRSRGSMPALGVSSCSETLKPSLTTRSVTASSTGSSRSQGLVHSSSPAATSAPSGTVRMVRVASSGSADSWVSASPSSSCSAALITG